VFPLGIFPAVMSGLIPQGTGERASPMGDSHWTLPKSFIGLICASCAQNDALEATLNHCVQRFELKNAENKGKMYW